MVSLQSEINNSESCPHANTRVKLVVLECEDCHIHIQRLLDGDMATTGQQLLQGKIDFDMVEKSGRFTTVQLDTLRAIAPCRHTNIEPYHCTCSDSTRYRCKDCELKADDTSTFERLRSEL